MKKLIWPISVTCLIVIFYLISVAVDLPYPIILWLFILVPALSIWMVVRILKDGKHSGKTFEDDFYEV